METASGGPESPQSQMGWAAFLELDLRLPAVAPEGGVGLHALELVQVGRGVGPFASQHLDAAPDPVCSMHVWWKAAESEGRECIATGWARQRRQTAAAAAKQQWHVHRSSPLPLFLPQKRTAVVRHVSEDTSAQRPRCPALCPGGQAH